MLIKGQDVANIIAGNTLSEESHPHAKFDYMLSNPPFGVEWKKVEKEVRKEHESQGFNGRFGPGFGSASPLTQPRRCRSALVKCTATPAEPRRGSSPVSISSSDLTAHNSPCLSLANT